MQQNLNPEWKLVKHWCKVSCVPTGDAYVPPQWAAYLTGRPIGRVKGLTRKRKHESKQRHASSKWAKYLTGRRNNTDVWHKRTWSLVKPFPEPHTNNAWWLKRRYPKIVPAVKSLAYVYPKVAAEWDDKANGPFHPSDVTAASSVRVWWLCPLGHQYHAPIKQRTCLGTGCPVCQASSCEIFVMGILARRNIYYVFNWRGHDCRGVGGRLLAFDFWIPAKNIAIEIDGPHHNPENNGLFSRRDPQHRNRLDRAKDQIDNDRRKNDYAQKKGFLLLRISTKSVRAPNFESWIMRILT